MNEMIYLHEIFNSYKELVMPDNPTVPFIYWLSGSKATPPPAS